jgi:methylmalonyl-CoA mutase
LAAFAAGVGGADAITVLPFDSALGESDAFARRLARNTQVLLIEEAHVARVLDPAGGSWYAERYTDELAQAAWDWFTTIERAGGLAAALDSGLVADRLAATWQRRESDIAHRRSPITGVSEFPNLAEELPHRPPGREAGAETGGRGGAETGRETGAAAGGGLPRRRFAAAFERLRDRSDAHLAATGQRPAVTLVTVGSAGSAAGRVAFATNLFAAGGVAVTTEPGPAVVCLCGADRAYAESAADAAEAARAGGARKVLLAGRGEFAGVDDYVFSGCDAVAALETVLADLGVQS